MALILDTNALSAFADGDERLLRIIETQTDAEIRPMPSNDVWISALAREYGLRSSAGTLTLNPCESCAC